MAQWYGLSDPELKDALADRLSFRRFAGLPLDGPVPDETTVCRFRGELARRGLADRLLAAVGAQLAAKGLILRRGTLIDATLVEADADVRKGPDGRPVTIERDAGFAKRRGKAFFGFKTHLAVDQGSGIVRRAILTPANINETLVARRSHHRRRGGGLRGQGLRQRGPADHRQSPAIRPSAPFAEVSQSGEQRRPLGDPALTS